MKNLILTFLLTFVTMSTYSQPHPFMFAINESKYVNTDSLLIERIYVHTGKEDMDVKDAISLGYGDYMFKLPSIFNKWLVIKTNSDRTKAIVVSHILGMRFTEFNMEENERRITLWYKDNKRYYGLVYDKEFKVCQQINDSKRNFRKRFEIKRKR